MSESTKSSGRAMKFAVAVVALAVLWIAVIPLINRSLDYDDPIKAGDQLLLAPGITFTPATGWNLENGLRTTDKTRTNAPGSPVLLTSGAITLNVAAAPFDGTPEDLIETIEKTSFFNGKETLTATGDKVSLPVQGSSEQGIGEHYTAPSSEGAVAAFVLGSTGVKLSVVGPTGQMNDQVDEVAEMLDGISYDRKKAEPKAGQGK